jgi:hypothetical protein
MSQLSDDQTKRKRTNLIIAWVLGLFVVIMGSSAWFILKGLAGGQS